MKIFVTTIGILLFLVSCGKDESKIVFSHQERTFIKEQTTKQNKITAKEVDSLCTLHFDHNVQMLVDSILKKRLEEKERLLNNH